MDKRLKNIIIVSYTFGIIMLWSILFSVVAILHARVQTEKLSKYYSPDAFNINLYVHNKK